MNEALLPVVNGLEFLSPPLPQEKQETLVRRVLEQGAVENLPGAQKASTAVPAIVPDAAAPPEKRRGGFRGRGRLWAVLAAALALCACTAVIGAVQYFAPMTRRTGARRGGGTIRRGLHEQGSDRGRPYHAHHGSFAG